MNRRRHARKRHAKVTGDLDEDEESIKRSIERVCRKPKETGSVSSVTMPDGTTFQLRSVRIVGRLRKLKVRWTVETE